MIPTPPRTAARRGDVPQLRLPGQAEAPAGPVDLALTYLVHHAIRRDLAIFRSAARRTPIGDRRTWRALDRRWQFFDGAVEKHHHVEDTGLWPLVGDRARERGDPDATGTLAAVVEEHTLLDHVLSQCGTGFSALADRAVERARTDLVADLDRATTLLTGHLAHEERHALALVQRHLSAADAACADRTFRAEYTWTEAALLVGWLRHLLPRRTSRAVRVHLGAGRSVAGHLLRPVFLARERHAFRYATSEGRAWVHDPAPAPARTGVPLPASDPDWMDLLDAYRTCEFATMTRAGAPIAWPTVAMPRPDGTLLVTTSIGLPQKALNVRRDPRVALLFSDPTGSGLTDVHPILVQGTATCPEEVVTDPLRIEPYWSRLHARQPMSRAFGANALSRRLMDVYYMRLLIEVRPRSRVEAPPLVPGIVPDDGPFRGYASAVLGTCEDGAPRLRRVVFRAGGGPGDVPLTVPGGAPTPGPASLLAHAHDDELAHLRASVVLGDLRPDPDGVPDHWRISVTREIPGPSSSPLGTVRTLLGLRRRATRYLAARGIPRPTVPWTRLRALP